MSGRAQNKQKSFLRSPSLSGFSISSPAGKIDDQERHSREEQPSRLIALSKFLEDALPSLPGFIARPLVGLAQIGRVFAGAHKAMPGAFVDDRIELLTGFFHQRLSPGDRRVDALVGGAVEAIDRRVDPGDIFFSIRSLAIE